ncbi:MAG: hypothetical protein PUG67_04890 [Peptoniphilaceae bacterium]|nr:hypothetical protein [Peptoniphilaceae bacterium]MDY6019418.1 hypothetical protein [Anaerococcus sp.]
MKKIIKFLIVALLLGFIFRVYSLNKTYPKDEKIKEYQLNEPITYKNIQIKVSGFKLNDLRGKDDPRILDVYFDVKNFTDKEISLYDVPNSFVLYQNFSNSVIQNTIEEGIPSDYKISYKKEDMVLKAKEEKKFTFKYMVEDYDMNRKNFLYINNNLYKDQYMDYFDKGYLFYEIINLGDIYE